MLMNKKAKSESLCRSDAAAANILVQISICSIANGHILKMDIFIGIFVTHTLINSLTQSVNLCNCFYLHFSTLWCPASGSNPNTLALALRSMLNVLWNRYVYTIRIESVHAEKENEEDRKEYNYLC